MGFVALALAISVALNKESFAAQEWIGLADDNQGFIRLESRQAFVPWGFNYDHEGDGSLLEDYWDDDWHTVATAFAEMKQLGANVVRIHLQFAAFMESPTRTRSNALHQLQRLVTLAERTGLYLDITGLGCYHKQDVPPWYVAMDERQRWAAQVVFWEAVAQACAGSPAIFCYDLMNEPVVPGGNSPRDDWLGPAFAGKHFVQFITLDRAGRERPDIARLWIQTLTQAIRRHDKRHLITVGLVPWSLDRPGLTSGFVPQEIAPDLDFIAVHIYPERDKRDDALKILQEFAAAGKPVVIEETFPLRCNADELGRFLEESRQFAHGWIGFYWGTTPEQYRQAPPSIANALALSWLELFQQKSATMLNLQE